VSESRKEGVGSLVRPAAKPQRSVRAIQIPSAPPVSDMHLRFSSSVCLLRLHGTAPLMACLFVRQRVRAAAIALSRLEHEHDHVHVHEHASYNHTSTLALSIRAAAVS